MATSAIRATVIKPKAFSEGQFLGKMLDVMQKTADVFEDDFKATTKTWKKKPPFEKKVTRKSDSLEAETSTDNEVYVWVNDGTGKRGGGSEYDIWAGFYTGKSDKKALFFSSDFVPKTKPGIIDSGPGWVGERDTLTPHVVHPGIEPRKFDEAIKKKREPWFFKEVNSGLKQATKASGHAMT